ncbi:MAG: nitronate monooxygenase [Pseudoxanthomonas sp.]
MRTPVCEMLGTDLPIFAFSHCRDVVVEVSRAGGFGVLGVSGETAEEMEANLRWIDEHIDGKPYGVDLLMPNRYEKVGDTQKLDPDKLIPKTHLDYIGGVLDQAGVPSLPAEHAAEIIKENREKLNMTPEDAEALLDIALQHPIKLVVSALGIAPTHLIERVHQHGIKVGALVGRVDQAIQQKEAGIDVLIAQGAEAGGHTGSVTSLVLWPQVVDAVAPLPVLAAGGIGRGRQILAALALGAQGVWCGSIWLGSRQSEVTPEMKERLFEARSEDAIQSRALTGKPCRMLKSGFTDAWVAPSAPKPLPMPLQTMMMSEAIARANRAHDKRFITYPVGQIVGDMKSETSCRQIIEDMLNEYVDATESLNQLSME